MAPNKPCTCGSGRKFKKCCGKVVNEVGKEKEERLKAQASYEEKAREKEQKRRELLEKAVKGTLGTEGGDDKEDSKDEIKKSEEKK